MKKKRGFVFFLVLIVLLILVSVIIIKKPVKPTGYDTSNGTCYTPDILNSASFESGWNGFTDWAGQTPSCTRATDQAYFGNYSAEYDFSPNSADAGCHMIYHFAGQDKVYVKYYFKVTNHITSTWKWARVADTGFTNFGGVWLENDADGSGIIDWGWDSEDSSIITTIGLNESQVIDGNWHSLEFEYCRNNCTNSDNPNNYPFACFWFDGKQQYAQLNGTSKVKYYGAGNSDYWANGCLYAGMRSSTNQIGYQTFMSTLNQGNTATGQSNIDNVSISTQFIGCSTPSLDTTPPVISNGAPSGTLAAGTTSITLNVTTNEAATCKYSTVANTQYSSMTNTFTISGGTTHSTTISGLQNGIQYNYYIKCSDTSGNADTVDYPISFNVASLSQAPPAQSNVLFTENFEDTNFAARGWYDIGGFATTNSEHIPGSTNSYVAHFTTGATKPAGGSGGRHTMNATDSVYLSYWIKYSTNWIGSNESYQPHEFLFVTNEDDAYVGPAFTNLTLYSEDNYVSGSGIVNVVSLQDGRNINQSKIGQDLTNITEKRAVSGCNGNSDGYAPSSTCYYDGSEYNNGKSWKSGVVFTDSTKNSWHFVEVYYKLNTIVNGIGQNNGIVQEWVDGNIVTNKTNVLYRTGAHPNMEINQMLLLPYIGDGSPVDQSFWIDNITVATGVSGTSQINQTIPDTFPPMITISTPSQNQVLASGTTSTALIATTNEAATCKYDTSNLAYDNMTKTFTTTGGTSHSVIISGLSNGSSYTYYIRCADASGNKNNASTTISFSVSSPSIYCGDGICNNGETSTTCLQDCPLPLCVLTSAGWGKTNATEGEDVKMVLTGTNCNGKNLTFSVIESDLLGNYNVSINPKDTMFVGNSANGTWTAEWQNVGIIGTLLGIIGLAPDPNYFFTATVVGTNITIKSPTDSANLLHVYKNQTVSNTTNNSTPTLYCGDGICNNGETSTTCLQDCPLPPSCVLTSASWSTTNATQNDTVYLNVAGSNCNYKTILFTVKKYNFLLPDTDVQTNPLGVIFTGNSTKGSWIAEWQPAGIGQSSPPEYYFTASVLDSAESISSGTSDAQMLHVYQKILNSTVCGDGICNGTESSATCIQDCPLPVSLSPRSISYNWSQWYSNQTTNLSAYNSSQLQNMSNVTFANQYGKILFTQNINISRDIDLKNEILISQNKVFVDSVNISEFNKSATLTLNNVPFTNPIIKRDGIDCSPYICKNQTFNSSTKTFTFTVTQFSTYLIVDQCSDGIQNYNETGIDCGGSCIACPAKTAGGNSGGGSSGGGGGGSSTTTSTNTANMTTVVSTTGAFNLTPESPGVFTNFGSTSGVQQVKINVNQTANNVSVVVSQYSSKPEEIPVDKSGNVYEYIHIEPQNVGSSLSSATVSFNVNKSWADGNGIPVGNVAFFKFYNDSNTWVELNTTYTGSYSSYYQYSVQVPGFNYFAIAETGQASVSGNAASGNNILFWIIVAIVLAAAILIIALIIRIRKRRKYLYKNNKFY